MNDYPEEEEKYQAINLVIYKHQDDFFLVIVNCQLSAIKVYYNVLFSFLLNHGSNMNKSILHTDVYLFFLLGHVVAVCENVGKALPALNPKLFVPRCCSFSMRFSSNRKQPCWMICHLFAKQNVSLQVGQSNLLLISQNTHAHPQTTQFRMLKWFTL